MASGISAVSGSTWAQNHPGRTEVNARLNNQAVRIADGFENGTLTAAQATQLLGQDGGVRQQEQQMASLNGTHLTGAEWRSLNQEEGELSAQIKSMKAAAQTA
jgi:hypothetical protein